MLKIFYRADIYKKRKENINYDKFEIGRKSSKSTV